jgi:glycosyltransferase involved in cell wall biosynthesis
VPFIADLRDPWTSNPYYSFSCRLLNDRAKRLERSVFDAATSVITNTEGLCQVLRREHPELRDRFVAITNGYDLDTPLQHSEPLNSPEDSSIELSHFGTVYGKRNPFPLFEAIAQVLKSTPGLTERLKLKFIGAWENADSRCESLALELEKQGILRRDPPIPHQLCLSQMAKAKALLILQPDSPLQVPAKIYEYIATGRPLVVIGGEGATADLVKDNHLGLCCRNETASLTRLLEGLVAGHDSLKPPDMENVTRFHYRWLTRHLAGVLDAAHPGRNAQLTDNRTEGLDHEDSPHSTTCSGSDSIG